MQASAGFFTYFYVLHDYGLRPGATIGLATELGFIPNPGDVYNPNALNMGNSNYLKKDFEVMLDWNGVKHAGVDFRLFYTSRGPDSWARCRWQGVGEGLGFYRNSYVTGTQICYTTEALRYAQSGYLVSIVCVQWSDLLICKTRALSISQQGMSNRVAQFGLFFETAVVATISYIPWVNRPLGTRQIAFPHFAVPSFSFFCVIMAYDELRKIFLRNGIKKSKRGRSTYPGWVVRNTYY